MSAVAYFVFVLLLSVFMVSVQGEISNVSPSPPFREYYQNLTGGINDCLRNDATSSNICSDLQSSLTLSTLVYYETDTLLNNIDEVIPVIDLLLRHLTDKNSLQITLGLPYLNYETKYFLDNRLKDVYFSTKVVFSEATKRKLTSYVTSIVLTLFGTDSNSQSRLTSGWSLKTRRPIAEHVKEFMHWHFGEAFHLPVGVAFSFEQQEYILGSPHTIFSQLEAAEFVIVKADFDISSDTDRFSIFPEFINHTLQNNDRTRRVREFIETHHLIMPISWMINLKDTRQSMTYTMNRRLPLYKWLLQAPAYESTVKEFRPIWVEMCMNIFVDLVPHINQALIITDQYQILPPAAELNERRFKLVPSFKQTHMIGYFQELYRNISGYRGTSQEVILNEETWGIIVRHSKQLQSLSECNKPTSINVIMEVTEGIRSSWNVLEEYMKEVLWTYSSLGTMKISNIVFDSEDIHLSTNIQSFVNATMALNISVGCSVDYPSPIYNEYVFPDESSLNFRSKIEKNVCGPLFDVIDTFIWKVNLGYGLGLTYFDVFLSREIFLREFPGKKVMLRFSNFQAGTQEVNYA